MNIPLSDAIERILDLIDQGASSSTIILNIVAVTPRYVHKHFSDVALQRGTRSPEVARLRECLDEATRAMSAQAPTVHVQHVISRALLRQFCEAVRAKSGPEVMQWDLLHRKSYLRSPAAVGFVRDFVRIDSATTEALWATVEHRLPEAIHATSTGNPVIAPGLRDVLRDAVTLHLVRNPRTLAVHDRTFGEVFARNVERYAGSPLADEAFRRRYGIYPGGQEGRRESAELLLAEIRVNYDRGTLFRFRVEDHFQRFREQLRQQQLQIIAISPGLDIEFLIGDGPVQVAAFDGTRLTPTPLVSATHVMLPLAPLVLAVLGPPALAALPRDDLVRQVNCLEVLGAERYIYHRPGADFSHDIAGWLNWTP